MELRHLRAFVTVAESRSFSKAARHLYVSQPPLSRHIRQLEEELGVTVFERTPSGVTLTREGTLLLERARTVLAEANAFLELASRAKVGAANPLKVGMARGLCEVVNRIRLDLASRHPEIAIEGIDMASSLQYDALREKSIDVGVSRHVTDDPAVEYEPLFEEHFVVVVSEQSPLAKHKSLTLKQLANTTVTVARSRVGGAVARQDSGVVRRSRCDPTRNHAARRAGRTGIDAGRGLGSRRRAGTSKSAQSQLRSSQRRRRGSTR